MDRFEEVKTRIKEGVDLVATVEEYVPLKTRGRYHVGLCPFHQERTPSFTVYSDTQHFKCYGCGEAGDVYSFLMKRDGLSFRETVELLADRLGISTQGVFGRGQSDRSSRSRTDVHGALARVAEWFTAELQGAAGAAARSYLAERGLAAAVEGFRLGFHPTGGRLRAFVELEKLPLSDLEEAGLFGADGYERFAGRLMFPIEDERGRTMGFGGRVLKSGVELAKYVNSSESPFFNKRKLLFGLKQAKKAGVRKLIVMEGYTDVIAAHLAGFEGAVATLGTALTTDHARLLERYATDGVVLLFDGDRAGRQAADRAFRELIHTRLPVSIALLDEGTDPADLVCARPGRDEEAVAKGREFLRGIVDGADDALTVWFRLQHQQMDLTLDVHIERLAAECGRILKSVADPVRRAALGPRMAQHLGVPEAAFRQAVSKIRAPRRATSPSDETGTVAAAADVDPNDPWATATPRPAASAGVHPEGHHDHRLAETDFDLLACLLAMPELVGDIDGVEVTLPAISDILGFFRAGFAKGYRNKDEIVGYLFMECAERPDLSKHLASSWDRAAHIKSPSEAFSLLLQDRSAHASRQSAQTTRLRLQQAKAKGDQAEFDKLTKEYIDQLRSRTAGS